MRISSLHPRTAYEYFLNTGSWDRATLALEKNEVNPHTGNPYGKTAVWYAGWTYILENWKECKSDLAKMGFSEALGTMDSWRYFIVDRAMTIHGRHTPFKLYKYCLRHGLINELREFLNKPQKFFTLRYINNLKDEIGKFIQDDNAKLILDLYKKRCIICLTTKSIQIHEIVPRSLSSDPLQIQNRVLLCKDCHNSVHTTGTRYKVDRVFKRRDMRLKAYYGTIDFGEILEKGDFLVREGRDVIWQV